MSQAAAEKFLTEEEYFQLEARSKIRHEFMDGEIFALAGATLKHNLATTNVATELNLKLRESDREVYAGGFRVRIREGHNVYPDVAVAFGEIQTVDNDKTLLNPVAVFEVLSKSTEKRDRGEKAEDYFRLESLWDYVLVSQYYVRVQHFSRQKNNVWTLKIYEDLADEVDLKSINCKISLKMIYLN